MKTVPGEDELILTDLYDRPIGHAGKTEVHAKGLLHRAFSVFLVHGGRMLIQKRHPAKYHSGGLWTNACCSHPRRGEETEAAVHRRLKEELGIDCPVREEFSFCYRSRFREELAEYEFDHVFLGDWDGEADFDPSEVEEVQWIGYADLERWMEESPEDFTVWFITAAAKILEILEKRSGNAGA